MSTSKMFRLAAVMEELGVTSIEQVKDIPTILSQGKFDALRLPFLSKLQAEQTTVNSSNEKKEALVHD